MKPNLPLPGGSVVGVALSTVRISGEIHVKAQTSECRLGADGSEVNFAATDPPGTVSTSARQQRKEEQNRSEDKPAPLRPKKSTTQRDRMASTIELQCDSEEGLLRCCCML